MKYILKTQEEPTDFANWKSTQRTTIDQKLAEGVSGDTLWELLPSSLPRPETEVEESILYSKSMLRRALLEEQGYLCCYCNRALSESYTTIIEHFKPKGLLTYRNQTFDYQNLLACCDGGERDKGKLRESYCSLYKGSKDPSSPFSIISPLEAACEDSFEYDERGQILAVTSDSRSEYTIGFLNLRAKSLQLQRAAAINTYIYEIWSEEMDTAAELDRLKTKMNGKFEPFCMAICSVLLRYP